MLYLVFFLFCLCVHGIAYAVSTRRKRKIIASMKMPIREVEVYNEFLDLEQRYLQLKEAGELDGLPEIAKLENDISAFLDVVQYRIDMNNIIIAEAKANTDVIQKELDGCPESVRKLLHDRRRLIMKIVLLQNKGTSYIICNKEASRFDVWIVWLELSFKIVILRALEAIRYLLSNGSDDDNSVRKEIYESSRKILDPDYARQA